MLFRHTNKISPLRVLRQNTTSWAYIYISYSSSQFPSFVSFFFSFFFVSSRGGWGGYQQKNKKTFCLSFFQRVLTRSFFAPSATKACMQSFTSLSLFLTPPSKEICVMESGILTRPSHRCCVFINLFMLQN